METSSGIMSAPSFVKIDRLVQELLWGPGARILRQMQKHGC
jgi:hypothetical protein